ncbi:MAG: hypothetical protein ABR576_06595, partial [Thermoanaerobaculia bacterium]
MRTRKLDSLILASLVGLALAGWMTLGTVACQQREQTQAAATPAPELAEGTTTTTTTTTTVVETNLTADPVLASQRNATVRRQKKPVAQARRSEPR